MTSSYDHGTSNRQQANSTSAGHHCPPSMRFVSLLLPLVIGLFAFAVLELLGSDSLSSSSDPETPHPVNTPHVPLYFASDIPMSTVAVIGSTGSVGQAVIHSLSSHPSIAAIHALTRRDFFKSPGPSLHQHVVGDMHALQPSDFHDASIVYCCLGTTRADAGGAAEFQRDDHDLIVHVARQAKAAGVQSFQLVSSLGADPHSFALYTKSKGQTEEDVKALSFPSLAIWRPSMLDTSSYPRPRKRLIEGLALPAFKLLSPLLGKSRVIKVETVADAMIKDSLSGRKGIKLYDGTAEIEDFLKAEKEEAKQPTA